MPVFFFSGFARGVTACRQLYWIMPVRNVPTYSRRQNDRVGSSRLMNAASSLCIFTVLVKNIFTRQVCGVPRRNIGIAATSDCHNLWQFVTTLSGSRFLFVLWHSRHLRATMLALLPVGHGRADGVTSNKESRRTAGLAFSVLFYASFSLCWRYSISSARFPCP